MKIIRNVICLFLILFGIGCILISRISFDMMKAGISSINSDRYVGDWGRIVLGLVLILAGIVFKAKKEVKQPKP